MLSMESSTEQQSRAGELHCIAASSALYIVIICLKIPLVVPGLRFSCITLKSVKCADFPRGWWWGGGDTHRKARRNL